MKKRFMTAAVALGMMVSFSNQANAQEKIHTVQPGDTLWKIAQSYNLSTQDLIQNNNLSSTMIYVGQELSLVAPNSSQATTYTVKPGDSLYIIANTYHTTITDLMKTNNLSSSMIYVGQVLTIPNNSQTLLTTTTYKVESGDTLWIIANKFGLSISQLKTYNQLTSDVLHVGQILRLTAESNSSFNAEALISEGKKYIGVPYVWGGNTPDGFDCSGFLKYVYQTQGITIPRTVETIWDATKTVSTPQKGDIVFFTTSKPGPSHAGIYLGNNQFLHAGSSTGVTISDLNNSYWKPRYLGAKSVK